MNSSQTLRAPRKGYHISSNLKKVLPFFVHKKKTGKCLDLCNQKRHEAPIFYRPISNLNTFYFSFTNFARPPWMSFFFALVKLEIIKHIWIIENGPDFSRKQNKNVKPIPAKEGTGRKILLEFVPNEWAGFQPPASGWNPKRVLSTRLLFYHL